MRLTSLFVLLACFLQHATAQEKALLVVHEWGTFTSLQDESGRAIGGINTDDEAVPDFVHTIQGDLMLWPTDLPPSYFQKGYPQLHPDVTLRLETPVMYFYPPEGNQAPIELDVKASFKGGWLTEYYPQAQVEAPGLRQQRPDGLTVLGGIDEHTVGTLSWEGLCIGGDREGPQTEERVWLIPRQVQAASVTTPAGEREKYLFYRGVGHLESLMRVQRSAEGLWLEIHPQPEWGMEAKAEGLVHKAWLVDIRKDGKSAFRSLEALALREEEVLGRVPARFTEGEFSVENLVQLRASMRQALIAEGLFADEADAMLGTWEAAYFQSPGLRLFFTVPQAWTDHYLPLEFSKPVALTRVMVGRIELVTPEQRALLAQIASRPVEPFPREAVWKVLNGGSTEAYRERPEWIRRTTVLGGLGLPLPECFQNYLALGRMRNALILNELALRPTPHLEMFINEYRLSGHQGSAYQTTGANSAKGRPWGPEQATGEPDTPVAGDIPTAWASRTPDSQPEWLLLQYEEAIQPIAVNVHETFHPGALVKVSVFDPLGEEIAVWSGVDPTPASSSHGVSEIPIRVDFELTRIKLYLDSPASTGWNEIDAVGLVEADETIHWASAAQASTSFADVSMSR
jgi:hypothetical protein